MKTSRPVISRASRASLTAVELIRSKSSSRKCAASLRRFAPNVFVSIRSAPALMKLTCSDTTASGARRFASSGERRRGTALVEQGAHAAVGHDHGAVGKALEERFAHAATLGVRPWGSAHPLSLDRG